MKPGFRFGINGPHAARAMMPDDLLPLRHHKVSKGKAARINDHLLTPAGKRAAHPKD